MGTTTILTIIWLAIKIGGAALAALVALAKLVGIVDGKRQSHCPGIQHAVTKSHRLWDRIAQLPTRKAPIMGGRRLERVARLADVANFIQTGDGGAFAGRKFHSYVIRSWTMSAVSHTWFPYRDAHGDLWIIDSAEGSGVSMRSLAEDVKKFPGQYYWAPIAKEFQGVDHETSLPRYDRNKAAMAALDLVVQQTKYGWLGIVLQLFIHTPVLRELAYFTGVASWPFFRRRPFCSQARTRFSRAGGLDPVNGRDEQLVTPQDDFQSAVYGEWVALVP